MSPDPVHKVPRDLLFPSEIGQERVQDNVLPGEGCAELCPAVLAAPHARPEAPTQPASQQCVAYVCSVTLPASTVYKACGFCLVCVSLGAELGCEEPADLCH